MNEASPQTATRRRTSFITRLFIGRLASLGYTVRAVGAATGLALVGYYRAQLAGAPLPRPQGDAAFYAYQLERAAECHGQWWRDRRRIAGSGIRIRPSSPSIRASSKAST